MFYNYIMNNDPLSCIFEMETMEWLYALRGAQNM